MYSPVGKVIWRHTLLAKENRTISEEKDTTQGYLKNSCFLHNKNHSFYFRRFTEVIQIYQK